MNITIGKYIPGNSIIHRLDPRLKLLINILFIVLVFQTKNLVMQGMLLTTMIIAFLSTRMPIKNLFKMLPPVIFIGLFLFLVNAFIVSDDAAKIYHEWWKLKISDVVINRTALIMIRIYIMIIGTTLLTISTRPSALTRAIEDLLLPLKFLFIPVHIIAMIISIALRFIPTLLEEAQRIMKAQASRGVDFKNGSLKSKAKAIITLVIPLFISAFNKAEDLGDAMSTRGYDPYEKRTRYRHYPIKFIDVIIFIFIISLATIVMLEKYGIFNLPTWI